MRGFAIWTFSLLLLGAGVELAAAQNKPVVISGAGNIAPLIEKYRKLIGEPNNADGPAQPGGRREINWDGVPDDKAAPAFLAPDAFKTRGARLNTPGKGVQVSAKTGNPSNAAPSFGHINPTYTKIFKPFSGERLFSPVGSNIVDLTFTVPGTDTPALVRGFGAVYVDVDQPHTSFRYFDANGKLLGAFRVPIRNNGFSFLGVAFDKPVVARVRIEYGTVALGPDDGRKNDVSVMDDFIFSEPQPR